MPDTNPEPTSLIDAAVKLITSLINAAVRLGLRRVIKACFPLVAAVLIALTGNLLPWPWNQVFYGIGAALAVIGAAVLIVVSTVHRN